MAFSGVGAPREPSLRLARDRGLLEDFSPVAAPVRGLRASAVPVAEPPDRHLAGGGGLRREPPRPLRGGTRLAMGSGRVLGGLGLGGLGGAPQGTAFPVLG